MALINATLIFRDNANISYAGIVLLSGSDNIGPFQLDGGTYSITAAAANWGSITLELLAADGVTFVPVIPTLGLAGTETIDPITANGQYMFILPKGTYQIAVSVAGSVSGGVLTGASIAIQRCVAYIPH